jgi:hypothetical protein
MTETSTYATFRPNMTDAERAEALASNSPRFAPELTSQQWTDNYDEWNRNRWNTERDAYREIEVPEGFERTTVGLNYAFNIINWATGVQVSDSGMFGGYAVYRPASLRNTGAACFALVATFAEAMAIARAELPRAAAVMTRRHATALKMNAAR